MLKWIEIDRRIIKANAAAIKRELGPGVKLMAVVKADGYGHGAVEVARTALENGAECASRLFQARADAPHH